MPFVNVSGVNLEYEWYGPPSAEATTIVLLHGGLGSLAAWGDYPQQIAEQTGCGVLAYSRMGSGKSDPAPLPRPVSFMHEEALNYLPPVLSTFEIRTAVLVGHSDGASIAVIHCGSGISPVRIQALVLEAPHVFVEKETIESISKNLEYYKTGDLKSKLEKYHQDVDHSFLGWVDVWLNPAFRSWNIEEFLPEIRVPSLVIQGEEDEFGTMAQVESIREKSGGPVQIKIFPQCGHRPHKRYPRETIQAIAEFLR